MDWGRHYISSIELVNKGNRVAARPFLQTILDSWPDLSCAFQGTRLQEGTFLKFCLCGFYVDSKAVRRLIEYKPPSSHKGESPLISGYLCLVSVNLMNCAINHDIIAMSETDCSVDLTSSLLLEFQRENIWAGKSVPLDAGMPTELVFRLLP
jgi:hypothetical protein